MLLATPPAQRIVPEEIDEGGHVADGRNVSSETLLLPSSVGRISGSASLHDSGNCDIGRNAYGIRRHVK